MADIKKTGGAGYPPKNQTKNRLAVYVGGAWPLGTESNVSVTQQVMKELRLTERFTSFGRTVLATNMRRCLLSRKWRQNRR